MATESHPRNLLSLPRLKRASSRTRPSNLQADTQGPDVLELERRLLPDELPLVPRLAMNGTACWTRDGRAPVLSNRAALRRLPPGLGQTPQAAKAPERNHSLTSIETQLSPEDTMPATHSLRAEGRRTTAARPQALPAFSSTAPWIALPASARRFAAAIARLRATAAQRHALQSLDARTLRDIGLDRSEIDSVAAESAGSAPLTRRRVTTD